MRNDLLINDGGAVGGNNDVVDPDAPVRTWCFAMIRLRQNGNYDFFCLRNVKKGQIYLMLISVVLLVCLILYALV